MDAALVKILQNRQAELTETLIMQARTSHVVIYGVGPESKAKQLGFMPLKAPSTVPCT